MALTITITRGYTMTAGARLSVADWNAAFLPNVTITGSVGSSDLDADAVLFAALNPNLILGGTVVTEVALADKLLVGSVAATDNRVVTFEHLLRSMVRASAEGTEFSAFAGDRLLVWSDADDLARGMTVARFLEESLNDAPTASVTQSAWKVLVQRTTEAAGSQAAAVEIGNLLPDVITAATVNNPTQIQVNAKGQVIGISNTAGSDRFTSALTALPSAAGSANQVNVAHGLGAAPAVVAMWLQCTDAGGDGTWAQGDVVDWQSVIFDNGANRVPFVLRRDATNISILRPSGTSIYIPQKTDGTSQSFDPSKWQAVISAIR